MWVKKWPKILQTRLVFTFSVLPQHSVGYISWEIGSFLNVRFFYKMHAFYLQNLSLRNNQESELKGLILVLSVIVKYWEELTCLKMRNG